MIDKDWSGNLIRLSLSWLRRTSFPQVMFEKHPKTVAQVEDEKYEASATEESLQVGDLWYFFFRSNTASFFLNSSSVFNSYRPFSSGDPLESFDNEWTKIFILGGSEGFSTWWKDSKSWRKRPTWLKAILQNSKTSSCLTMNNLTMYTYPWKTYIL